MTPDKIKQAAEAWAAEKYPDAYGLKLKRERTVCMNGYVAGYTACQRDVQPLVEALRKIVGGDITPRLLSREALKEWEQENES